MLVSDVAAARATKLLDHFLPIVRNRRRKWPDLVSAGSKTVPHYVGAVTDAGCAARNAIRRPRLVPMLLNARLYAAIVVLLDGMASVR